MNNDQNNNPQIISLNNMNITPNNKKNDDDSNNNSNKFINTISNPTSTNLNLNNQLQPQNNLNQNDASPINNLNVEDAKLKSQVVGVEQNQFINKNTDYNKTSLNDLNVDGKYNKLEKSIYAEEPVVKQNLENIKNKKVTVTVTQEMKVFIIIALIILVFIFIMPNIFDLIQNIKY